ncbi:MAG: nucleoside monophosphate kinase [Candidatus Woesearchaeota archaeon]
MRIVFLGSPGVGKGVYAQLLAETYPWPHISTGHLLREEIQEGSIIGKKAESFMLQGKLVPDIIVIELLRKRLAESDAKNGFFLDGFPRTLEQARELDGITKIDKVINFEADEEKIVHRLAGRLTCEECGKIHHASTGLKEDDPCEACGSPIYRREDDHESKVRARLHEYENKTKPLIEYYLKMGKLVRIKHNEPIANSKEAFLAKVRPHLI